MFRPYQSTDLLKPIGDWFKSVDWGNVIGKIVEALGALVTFFVGAQLLSAINIFAAMLEGLVQMFSGVIQVIRGFVDILYGVFTGDLDKIKEGAMRALNGIGDLFVGLFDMTVGAVIAWVEAIIGWFVELWDVLVGHSIVPDMINAIVDWFLSLPGKILGSVENFVKSVVDKFISLGTSLTNAFSSAWEAVKTWWNQKPSLSSYLPSIGDIKAKLSEAWTAAKDWWDKSKAQLATYTPSIGKIWEKLKAAWETAITWWTKNKVALTTYTPSIGKIWEKLKASWENARTWWSKNKIALSTYTPSIGKIWEKVKSSWETARTWWSKNKVAFSTYTPSIGSIKDKVISAWNSAKDWWKRNASLSSLTTKLNISVPTISVKWATAEAFGKSFKYPTGFSLKFAADGGIFDAGSLIWAGERGAEIVANAGGGKTGVMNVQQMQDAVYEGVYAAMSAAMRGQSSGGTSQEIRVYLDGKEITASVKKHQHESGVTLMGNEVYSY